MGKYCFGVDVGGTTVKLGLFNTNGDLMEKWEIPTVTVEIAKDVWQYDLGNAPEEFKSVELYVKPEESAVYYVINGTTSGSFGI